MSAEPEVRVTQYAVSLIPETSVNRHGWEVTVDYWGEGLWAVRHGSSCLGRDGTVSYESIPSECHEEWLERYRFTEQEALDRAMEWAKVIRVNGKTAAEILEWEADHD